jgi:hypothetical protein
MAPRTACPVHLIFQRQRSDDKEPNPNRSPTSSVVRPETTKRARSTTTDSRCIIYHHPLAPDSGTTRPVVFPHYHYSVLHHGSAHNT